jgi:hypothetical protein
MSVSSEGKPSSERPVEIGPPPYYHRGPARLFPGCDGTRAPLPPVARTEEERGRTSGSGLPGAAAPAYSLVQRGRSDVTQDPRAVRAVLTAVSGKICESPSDFKLLASLPLESTGRRFPFRRDSRATPSPQVRRPRRGGRHRSQPGPVTVRRRVSSWGSGLRGNLHMNHT